MASLFGHLMLACAALAASNVAGFGVGLTRIQLGDTDATAASELMRDAAARRDTSRHVRLRRELASSGTTVAAPTRKDRPNGGAYLMTLAIGTPPTAFPAIVDTGSALSMTQCAPCSSNTCINTSVPVYDPSSSTTFAALPCNSSLRPGVCAGAGAGAADDGGGCPPCTRSQTYTKGWTFATLGVETFTFNSTTPAADQVTTVPDVAFGCINGSSGDDWGGGSVGMVGLGRGPLSLVSQMGAGRFSYCLTPFQDASSTSTLVLGPSAALDNTTGRVRSTPFVANPAEAPMSTYYYLNLTGISIGDKALPIPRDAFALQANGSGGVIIDSGWTTTSLVGAAYQQVRAEVRSLLGQLPLASASSASRLHLDLCFELPSQQAPTTKLPDMTFHFDGGADMVLPADNYMFLSSDGLWCLCMTNNSSPDDRTSTLGNYQQQNIHFLYDVQNGMLSFAPANCSTGKANSSIGGSSHHMFSLLICIVICMILYL